MGADRVSYLDSSAIVKLVVHEQESQALRTYLRRRRPIVSSALARVEVTRAVLPLGPRAAKRAEDVLRSIDLIRVNTRVLATAGTLEPHELRTPDAIHLATAALLGNSMARIVCYDDRLTKAAQTLGWKVDSPN
mgnify:FL=1